MRHGAYNRYPIPDTEVRIVFNPPFCPWEACMLHNDPPAGHGWWSLNGTHSTKAFGDVQRYRCKACGRTFSAQTFSVHYYAKKVINLRQVEGLASSSMSLRSMAREMSCTCDTVTNRIDRIARQGIALHATLRKIITRTEDVCFDGLVSFDDSQYFPSDIGLSITADSRFILAASHATTRRSGSMSQSQKEKRDELYADCVFERKAIERSFRQHLDMLTDERTITKEAPLIIRTDLKKEYGRALRTHRLYRNQSEERRVGRIMVSSKLARNFQNPLFASNYLDREIRKDQANHRRESTCHSRSAANTMSRLYSYLVWHNYRKRYLIKAPVFNIETAAEVAGIDRALQERMRRKMFGRRAFLSHLDLQEIDLAIWVKEAYSQWTGGKVKSYIPAFAVG